MSVYVSVCLSSLRVLAYKRRTIPEAEVIVTVGTTLSLPMPPLNALLTPKPLPDTAPLALALALLLLTAVSPPAVPEKLDDIDDLAR
jgi:hypothetical protein